MKRRLFLKRMTALPAVVGARDLAAALPAAADPKAAAGAVASGRSPRAGRIVNEYCLFLPGEREALEDVPKLLAIESGRARVQHDSRSATLRVGESVDGWELVCILRSLRAEATAVFEKHVAHQGAIAYLTTEGEIAHIPKRVGRLSNIRPRRVNPPRKPGEFRRPAEYVPGPDVYGQYILSLDEDPCYENVAALGRELVGWTLVANGATGPEGSLWLEADGTSREFGTDPQSLWAPDMTGRLFDPHRFLPSAYHYDYTPGYSKRTLVGGYVPAADIGVWNPEYGVGYEVMVVLPSGTDAKPVGRVRAQRWQKDEPKTAGNEKPAATGPDRFVERTWNGSREDFFDALVGEWDRWHYFLESGMKASLPDPWLLEGARAGLALARASYRGLNPTYQIGEGAYTKIPERSHALFPVAHYEFVWAHQLWNLSAEVEPYFEHYLKHYILPDGNFLYNTQDQVEAPLNAGVFLENSARAYDYTGDAEALRRRLPVLLGMTDFVLDRYQYSKRRFPAEDPRHGLIWGSPEADKGNPHDDYPNSHPYYYQNASWTWRGLQEQARCLERAGRETGEAPLLQESKRLAGLAVAMRKDIERSLNTTLAARNPEMKRAGITPFYPFDTKRKPTELTSYENHRYMMDWWTSDWGDLALDEGHFRHREIAGLQILGLGTDGAYPRTSNFMEHGTLAGRIRQEDYRPFLLALYALGCYTMDSGSRYAPEDALLPGTFPGEGGRYGWSAVVNSELQLAMGLRWLLCYEEHDRAVVHLQKAAPKHWFAAGEEIRVENCPTRFGPISWATKSRNKGDWTTEIQFKKPFAADLIVHVHPPTRSPLRSTSFGELHRDRVRLPAALLKGRSSVSFRIE